MKELTVKQKERSEKKKRKLAALATLVQMNDKDRMEARNSNSSSSPEHTAAESENGTTVKLNQISDDIGFTKVKRKKKSKKLKKQSVVPTQEEEPTIKRLKLTDEDAGTTSDASLNSTERVELKNMKVTLSEKQYKELRRQLRERKRELENIPLIRLREPGRRALIETPDDKRTPIFLTDIQHLLMKVLLGSKSPCTPDRWCFIQKPKRLSHTVVLVLEGFSLYHYMANESKFQHTNKIFETRLEVVLPPYEEGMIIEELSQVPLTNVQAELLIKEYGSLESAVELIKDPILIVKKIFPIEKKEEESEVTDLHPGDKFPRTKLLLSALQLVDEGYPMPLLGDINRFKTYAFTKEQYAPVTNLSPMFGVDCEMCLTAAGITELTRISIVNEEMETIYESLVMPTDKITDYLTPYSGITPEIMKAVTKTLPEVQQEVSKLLPPDAILVGQSLNSDLNAMRMMHPYVIDTSVCYNISGERKRKAKLRTLALTFLQETIQEFKFGHDSVEDSKAALKLVKLKLANNIEFGDEILIQKKRYQETLRAAEGINVKNNLFGHVSTRDKRTAIVSSGPIKIKVKELLEKADEAGKTGDAMKAISIFEMESNKKALKKAREIALENALTIVNMKLTMDDSKVEAVQKTVETLDKWIRKLWTSVAHNGLFVVLMGGSAECPSGVVKITIKRDAADVAAEVPLTI